ncbi:hypothetical protein L7F22_038124 [Adiantum nelumboides]|nr:hypothetical protein [Adiantum nelumboides]
MKMRNAESIIVFLLLLYSVGKAVASSRAGVDLVRGPEGDSIGKASSVLTHTNGRGDDRGHADGCSFNGSMVWMELRQVHHPSSPFKHLHNVSLQERKKRALTAHIAYEQKLAKRYYTQSQVINNGDDEQQQKLQVSHSHGDKQQVLMSVNSRYKVRRELNEVDGLDDHLEGVKLAHASALDEKFFYAQMWMGTPPKLNTFLIDTGSDLTWVQCEPCTDCYHQGPGPDGLRIPYFDPKKSTSYKDMACDEPLCNVDAANICGADKRCRFDVNYGAGSEVKGYLGHEAVGIGANTEKNIFVPDYLFGCSEHALGQFDFNYGHGSGVLGLGSGPFSIASQLNTSLFFCLPHIFHDEVQSGILGFGPLPDLGRPPLDILSTRLLPAKSQYFVAMTGISVNGVTVPLTPLNINSRTPSNSGGVVIDTGTLVTLLEDFAYNQFRDAVRQVFEPANITAVGLKDVPFDTCFPATDDYLKLLYGNLVVALHFDDLSGKDTLTLPLPVTNVFIEFDEGTHCLAFSPNSKAQVPFNVLGGIQLTGTLVTIDSHSSIATFTPNSCW